MFFLLHIYTPSSNICEQDKRMSNSMKEIIHNLCIYFYIKKVQNLEIIVQKYWNKLKDVNLKKIDITFIERDHK